MIWRSAARLMILLASMTRRTSTGDTSRSSPGYGDDGAIVGAANMVAGDPDEDVRHVEAGHPFGLFRGGLDRLDRLVEVDHDPLRIPMEGASPTPTISSPFGPSTATTAQVLVVPISSPQTVSCFIRCLPYTPRRGWTTRYWGMSRANPTRGRDRDEGFAGVGEPVTNSLGTRLRTTWGQIVERERPFGPPVVLLS